MSVGEHDVRVHAEVVVTCGVLAAKIPNKIENTQPQHGREQLLFNPDPFTVNETLGSNQGRESKFISS